MLMKNDFFFTKVHWFGKVLIIAVKVQFSFILLPII